MFGRRHDGKKLKDIDGFFRMASMFVGRTRVEATNYMYLDYSTKKMDEYIAAKKLEGLDYTYADIFLACLIRVFYLRPRLNRFIVNGHFYQRHGIVVSMALHKNLKTGEQETTCKCRFTGKETIQEIKEMWHKTIESTLSGDNATDNFTGGALGRMPTWILKIIVGTLRKLDKWGMLSGKFIDNVSPFHCSIFFANMKSVHLGPHLHHLYNFGTCGFMCALGKEEWRAGVNPETGEVFPEQYISMGVSEDERFIDGLTYANVVKTVSRMIDNLSVLERAPEDDEIRHPVNSYQLAKEAKRAAKQEKKDAKRAKKGHVEA